MAPTKPRCSAIKQYKGRRESKISGPVYNTTFDKLLGSTSSNDCKVFESSDNSSGRGSCLNSKENSSTSKNIKWDNLEDNSDGQSERSPLTKGDGLSGLSSHRSSLIPSRGSNKRCRKKNLPRRIFKKKKSIERLKREVLRLYVRNVSSIGGFPESSTPSTATVPRASTSKDVTLPSSIDGSTNTSLNYFDIGSDPEKVTPPNYSIETSLHLKSCDKQSNNISNELSNYFEVLSINNSPQLNSEHGQIISPISGVTVSPQSPSNDVESINQQTDNELRTPLTTQSDDIEDPHECVSTPNCLGDEDSFVPSSIGYPSTPIFPVEGSTLSFYVTKRRHQRLINNYGLPLKKEGELLLGGHTPKIREYSTFLDCEVKRSTTVELKDRAVESLGFLPEADQIDVPTLKDCGFHVSGEPSCKKPEEDNNNAEDSFLSCENSGDSNFLGFSLSELHKPSFLSDYFKSYELRDSNSTSLTDYESYNNNCNMKVTGDMAEQLDLNKASSEEARTRFVARLSECYLSLKNPKHDFSGDDSNRDIFAEKIDTPKFLEFSDADLTKKRKYLDMQKLLADTNPDSQLPVVFEDDDSAEVDDCDKKEETKNMTRSESGGQTAPMSPCQSSPCSSRQASPSSPRHSSSEDEHSPIRRMEQPPKRRSSCRLHRTLGHIPEESDIAIIEQDNQETTVKEEHFVYMTGKKYRRSLSLLHNLLDCEEDCSIPLKNSEFRQSVEHYRKLLRKSKQSFGDTFHFVPSPRGDRSICGKLTLRPLNESDEFSLENSQLSSPKTNRLSKRNTSIAYQTCRSPSFCESLTVEEFRKSLNIVSSVPAVDRDFHQVIPNHEVIVKDICGQNEPCSFQDIFVEGCCEVRKKIGEGVYGEVFLLNRDNVDTVLKVIPIEGDLVINGAKQKTYEEIFSELIITRLTSNLRQGTESSCEGFVELMNSWIVIGSYPQNLLENWKEFDKEKGSDNDCPDVFPDNQLYLVLELSHCGQSLESYKFSSARQSFSVFKQVVLSLAVAENALNFEHRDLHWGNVLVSRTVKKVLDFVIEGKKFEMKTHGVKATIIDFTLSSANLSSSWRTYCDLGEDPELFLGTGDLQFEVYRQMKSDVNDEWVSFSPKTNVRWLNYLTDKLIHSAHYQRKTAGVHKTSIKSLKGIKSWIGNLENCYEVVVKMNDCL